MGLRKKIHFKSGIVYSGSKDFPSNSNASAVGDPKLKNLIYAFYLILLSQHFKYLLLFENSVL